MNRSGLINRFVSQLLLATILPGSSVFAGLETYDTLEGSSISSDKLVRNAGAARNSDRYSGWIAGLSGDTGVKGVVTSPDISFDELFNHLTHVPIALSADIRYQRWEFFGDGQYMEVGASATLPGLLFTNANLHLKSGLAEGFVGYRLINCDKASLSLFAGARYSYQGGDLSIFDNGDARLVILRQLLGIRKKLDFSGSTDWVDPVIGARGKVKLWKAISLYAEGDVGGFDVNSGSAFELRRQGRTIVREPVDSSDWSYQVQGGIEIPSDALDVVAGRLALLEIRLHPRGLHKQN